MTALEEIKKALEGDMNTGITAIDRLRFIVGGVPDFDPITVEDADWLISALESLQRANEELRQDRYDLAYAITGGEDAPGLLDSTPTSEIVEIAQHAHRCHHADIDRAMAAEAEAKRLTVSRDGYKRGRDSIQAEYDRLRASHSDEIEALTDKIEGLSADLDSAVGVAFNRGAHEWVRMNYPDRFEILSRTALASTGGEHYGN
ncbi:hypothetical protein [Agrobacterium tumefaciens]|uniref:Uncharacterized protein n=1 Tax=Agrobacterium tumefaciens TaxID=358 RepID=A0A2L2LBZ4_AGRTU|nr:hypothetical protein [Agrobacterium tumefaciens]AVH41875.1 hypothetical protein At1D1609_18210 [Agrobacterium tumefaciens]NSY95794.1 hypothetical protein [Agrobacterium tumefaciens]